MPENESSAAIIEGSMLVIFFCQFKIKRIKGGSWMRVRGGDFLGMGRPIGNILNPLWVFSNSLYYGL